MTFRFSAFKQKFMQLFAPSPTKIKLADNKPLSDAEYKKINHICDIFCAIRDAAGTEIIAPPQGGVFWNQAKPGMGPFELYLRKNRKEIDHLFLLFNAFRDFCALAYEYDEYSPAPDYWVRRYQRLSSAVPSHWNACLPARFGELGWNINGKPVNRWTSVNQERISTITLAGITRYLEQQSHAKILEIGGGAGEMGYTLSQALPNCTWFNADLLGCLIYSAIQLTINLPHKKHYIYVGNLKLKGKHDESLLIRSPEKAATCQNSMVYIPHFLLDDFKDHLKLHFAYNTYSFGEMPKTAVAHYASLLANFLQDDGVLFEQNGYFPERGGDNPEDILATQFRQLQLPPQLDGRWLPNGPTRLWCNNDTAMNIQHLVSRAEINHIIESLKDKEDKIDIHYPNEIMWPKVYELFSSPQIVKALFPWT